MSRRDRRRGRCLFALCVLVPALTGATVADGQEVPGRGEEMELLLRVLRFDAGAAERGPVRVAVLHMGDTIEAARVAADFREAGRDGFRGQPVTVVVLPFETSAGLLDTIADDSITVVYIPAALTPALQSVLSVTRSLRVPTFTGSRAMVERGVAIGTIAEARGGQLVINRRAAILEGVRLDARLLRLAEIVR